MGQKAWAARSDASAGDHRKAASFWSFLHRVTASPAPETAFADDNAFAADMISADFEGFGRVGLQLDGLHRDQQWVGAWGGRC